MTRVRATDVAV